MAGGDGGEALEEQLGGLELSCGNEVEAEGGDVRCERELSEARAIFRVLPPGVGFKVMRAGGSDQRLCFV